MFPATRRILVVLDDAATARATLPVARRLAADLAAEVTLLRVIPPVRAIAPAAFTDLAQPIDLAEQQATAELRAVAPAFPGRPVTPVVLVGAHPAAEIIRWLRANPVDFVVIAGDDRGRPWYRRGGGVAQAVLRSGLAPVVTVRPTSASTPMVA